MLQVNKWEEVDLLGWLITIVGSRIGKLAAGALAAMATILGLFYAGQRSEKKNQKIEDLEDFKDTKERIDEVKPSTDRDAALKRLRDNDQLR